MKEGSETTLYSVLTAGLVISLTIGMLAATEHFNDVTKDSVWSGWEQQWASSTSTDYQQVSLAPGKNETELSLGWYSKTGTTAAPVVRLATKEGMSDAKTLTGATSPAIDGHISNKVTVSGLKENSTYCYTYQVNGVESNSAKYATKSFSSFKMLFFGDPQISASKGQAVSIDNGLENKSTLNTIAGNDTFNWNKSLSIALKSNPDVSFALPAGDQINKNVNGTDPRNETEYARYLYPAALKSLPVTTTIGNHDTANKSYSSHFNNPNAFTQETSPSVVGNGYYYIYGNALFIVLNTNDYNCADHEALLKKATEKNPNTHWRIVIFHQDIYGSGLNHSESDSVVLRTQLTLILDRYDIDVVLQGHDHSYSRSYLLQGDGKTHPTYDANKLTGDTFDWDNMIDKSTKQVLPYYLDGRDTKAMAANALFLKGDEAYAIAGDKSTKVVNPQGILYMTANSATGSKFYELAHQQRDFVAYRSQNWQSSYSVLSLDDKTFSISTYSISQDRVNQIGSAFTIEKMVNRTPAVTTAAIGNTVKDTASTPKTTTPKTGDANDLTGASALAALTILGLTATDVATLKEKKGKLAKQTT